MRRFFDRIKNFFVPDKQLSAQLEHLLGYKPKHLPYYQLALMHRSKVEELSHNNERLEFLGDAILGSIVAEYLFKKYPNKHEGALTEMRSRIVRRETLNNIASRMGLSKIVQYNTNDRTFDRSHIFGNALEALVGAVYLDQGYSKTRTFVIKQCLQAYLDVELISNTDTNYKNQLLNWSQLKRHTIDFQIKDEIREGSRRKFEVAIMLNGAEFCTGSAYNKKDASQVAARKALELIDLER